MSRTHYTHVAQITGQWTGQYTGQYTEQWTGQCGAVIELEQPAGRGTKRRSGCRPIALPTPPAPDLVASGVWTWTDVSIGTLYNQNIDKINDVGNTRENQLTNINCRSNCFLHPIF